MHGCRVTNGCLVQSQADHCFTLVTPVVLPWPRLREPHIVLPLYAPQTLVPLAQTLIGSSSSNFMFCPAVPVVGFTVLLFAAFARRTLLRTGGHAVALDGSSYRLRAPAIANNCISHCLPQRHDEFPARNQDNETSDAPSAKLMRTPSSSEGAPYSTEVAVRAADGLFDSAAGVRLLSNNIEPMRRRALLAAVGAAGGLPDAAGAKADEPGAGWLFRLYSTDELGKDQLKQRLLSDELEKFPTNYVDFFGPSDVIYPDWVEGRWQIQQTLAKYSAPLGKKFLGATADKTLAEKQQQLCKPVTFELRYVRTARGDLVEDRAFNLKSRLNALAGKQVVKEVTYAEIPSYGPTKQSDGSDDPQLAAVVQFEGGISQKQFITRFVTERGDEGNVFRALVSQRVIFATGSGTVVSADEEAITSLRRKPDGSIVGRLRSVGYLNPKDELYFDAANRAVAIADYSMKLTAIVDADGGSADTMVRGG
ncbi:unnamed protein product [Prorocentrum cordatum]|uniref:DUF6816 domain-containing protein n=1 Tax=Prorocentrum cordatum TaxID=2364126 RepID=A0ABN9R6V4_9DINO|nr:unnamed protein product [Polarella glacialis]